MNEETVGMSQEHLAAAAQLGADNIRAMVELMPAASEGFVASFGDLISTFAAAGNLLEMLSYSGLSDEERLEEYLREG